MASGHQNKKVERTSCTRRAGMWTCGWEADTSKLVNHFFDALTEKVYRSKKWFKTLRDVRRIQNQLNAGHVCRVLRDREGTTILRRCSYVRDQGRFPRRTSPPSPPQSLPAWLANQETRQQLQVFIIIHRNRNRPRSRQLDLHRR